MSKLKAVQPKEARKPKPKILIYGKPGVGKTWASLDFPNVYFIDSEGGASLPHYTDKLVASNGVYLGQEQGALDFETILQQVKALATENHDYKTLIIDSISKVFNTYISDEIERLGDRDQYGASKKKPVAAMRKLIGWLSRLDMSVILIAHEKDEYGENARGERTVMGSTFDCWDKLEYELDLCLNIIKAGKNRNAFVRKSRLKEFDEGTYFPWSYAEFSDKYGKQAIERKAEAADLATAEQLAELQAIFKTKDIPAGLEQKWLKKSGVNGWDEMARDRVQAAIKHLNETY